MLPFGIGNKTLNPPYVFFGIPYVLWVKKKNIQDTYIVDYIVGVQDLRVVYRNSWAHKNRGKVCVGTKDL